VLRTSFAAFGALVGLMSFSLSIVAPSAFGFTSSSSATGVLQGQSGNSGARYYLALGDSLVVGYAASPGEGYVDDFLAHYDAAIPGLQLVDFGCSGETTTSFIDGPSCGDPDGSQLKAAETFLGAHASQIAFVTIDIGGNDMVDCGSLSPPFTTDRECVSSALSTVSSNLTQILAGLRDAGGSSVPIYAMNYFDPFVITWLEGQTGQTAAQSSVTVLNELNSELPSFYSSAAVAVANVASAFEVTDFSDLVSTQWGTIPVSVERACSWLDVSCLAGGPEGFGDDANSARYQVIATALEQLIESGMQPPRNTPTPPVVPTQSTTPQSATSAGPGASGTQATGGGLPFTGFPVKQLVFGALGFVLLGILLVRTSAVRSRRDLEDQ
jgi:lysophospholipase L1-like esterase